jgi:hypothetical protein
MSDGDRPLFRVGGAMAIGGALSAFVGNALHPRSTGYYGDPVAWLDHNTQSDIWFPSHLLILLGQVALVGGFVALSRSLAGTPGHGLATLGLANAQIGTALILVTLAIDGLVVAQLDGIWPVQGEPSGDAVLAGSILYHTVFSLLYVFQITLFGLAPVFYGTGMLLSGTYPRWFGYAGVLIGSVIVATALLSMFGVATEFLDAVVWTITASLWVAWFLISGMLLWRRPSVSNQNTSEG